MKFKKLQIITIICLITMTSGILLAKAEGIATTTRNFKSNMEDRFEKKDLRNEKTQMIKDLRASTTAQIKDIRREDRQETREDRREDRMEFKGERKEIVKKMQLKTFEIRKNSLVKELTFTIKNLTNIRTRIQERITAAESSGRDMTDAKAKLVIADGKLVIAKTAVDALNSYSYASSTPSSNASTTAEISLEKPRKIGDDAIKAVKDARDAFKSVVQVIAHAMGLNSTATTTVTVTSTSTNSTATTTASTTSN